MSSNLNLPPVDMTEQEYRTHPAISRSELWHMHESPEKFRWNKDHPPAPSDALLFGQYTHALLLEPDKVGDDFLVMPRLDTRTKIGKAEKDRLLEECAATHRKLVPADMAELAQAMVEKCRSDPEVMALLDGVHEQPFFWVDEDTGEECKCRTDCLTTVDGIPTIIDYKTAQSAATHSFVRDIYKYGYHFQSGMYGTGVKQCLGLDRLPRFIFIVQEKKPPYSINRVEVSEEVIQYGVDLFREYIGIYHQCKEMDWWYGYNGVTGLNNEAPLLEWAKQPDDNE